MEAIAKMKTTTKPPMCITFRETVACEDNTKLSEDKTTRKPPMCIIYRETVASEDNAKLSEDHPFKSGKYIFEYIKKGTVLHEEHTNYKKNKHVLCSLYDQY